MNKKNDNFSEAHKLFLKKKRKEKYFIQTIRILLLVVLLGCWELFTRVGILDPFIMSSPSRVITTIFNTNNLLYHIGVTLYEASISFVLATGIGLIIAILLWWNEKVKKILEPYIVIINSLPKIALGPIIIIWFGTGTTSIVVMAFLIMIVITILSLLNSFISCDKEKILLMKSLGASKLQILIKLILPNSLIEFISVLKINVGMTWVGTIMGEYLVSRAGLGYLIVYGGQVFKLDLVMSATVVLCVLAGLMYGLVVLLERKMRR